MWLYRFFKVALLFTTVAAWLVLSPTQIGGQKSYIFVNGNSMMPLFARGDLVITQEQPRYAEGDAVAYQHPELGVVFHRIVEKEGQRFTLQGDNNDWLDGYRPLQDEIIGRLWFYIPNAGKWARWIRQPLVMAIVSVLIGLSFVYSPQESKIMQTTKTTQSEQLQSLLLITLIVCAGAWFVWQQPLTKAVSAEQTYTQTTNFSYWSAASDRLYESGFAETGEPIFWQSSEVLTVQLDYSVADVTFSQGEYTLTAELRHADGWKRTLPLITTSTIEAVPQQMMAQIQLAKLQQWIAAFTEETGVKPRTFELVIVPTVSMIGEIVGQDVQGGQSAEFHFEVTDKYLRFDSPSPTASQTASVSYFTPQPNTLTLFIWQLPFTLLRRITQVALLLVGGIWVWQIGRFAYRFRLSPMQRIQHDYGYLLLQVDSQQRPTDGNWLTSFHDLVRVAERAGAWILYAAEQDYVHYWVQVDGATYLIEQQPVPIPIEEAT